ncbi:hypothetical protein M441DRAFT_227443 [Trichoderma asperellum CBS 433.97]|uniref:Uncharacterized protein n=1 Tax=Trichoderma asperellum (strain ATCC 204424 / CBS 433.97 / NBRC 101777) TaxID=1042311 RepID=A0A2T3ZQ44_TRIA4|nr:hypothetical protein M441DRAFT_227443 [Trichoderma asperellum CBS 433.97]PTB46932.1 hypothetical protein M441DRAFT_227443 [Trichoderma asperellum CBS 433.97]
MRIGFSASTPAPLLERAPVAQCLAQGQRAAELRPSPKRLGPEVVVSLAVLQTRRSRHDALLGV